MTLGQSFFKKVLIFKQETNYDAQKDQLSIAMNLHKKVEGIPFTPFQGIESGAIGYKYLIQATEGGVMAELYYSYSQGLFEKKLIEISVNAFEEKWRQLLRSYRDRSED